MKEIEIAITTRLHLQTTTKCETRKSKIVEANEDCIKLTAQYCKLNFVIDQ